MIRADAHALLVAVARDVDRKDVFLLHGALRCRFLGKGHLLPMLAKLPLSLRPQISVLLLFCPRAETAVHGLNLHRRPLLILNSCRLDFGRLCQCSLVCLLREPLCVDLFRGLVKVLHTDQMGGFVPFTKLQLLKLLLLVGQLACLEAAEVTLDLCCGLGELSVCFSFACLLRSLLPHNVLLPGRKSTVHRLHLQRGILLLSLLNWHSSALGGFSLSRQWLLVFLFAGQVPSGTSLDCNRALLRLLSTFHLFLAFLSFNVRFPRGVSSKH
mmetsp:Transcript_26101/g.60232  ORF Transcript_26101/g.60232 Transcript_26101/m.60232 type:complete len:270 (+) Transcript_26101:837-1646(+)